MGSQHIGIVGLGVMGRNLALNLAEKGYKVAAFDPWPEARASLTAQLQSEADQALSGNIAMAETEQDLIAIRCKTPRFILFMVKAGDPVDALIDKLLPLLSENDSLIDGGNSHYQDTIRREKALNARGINFFGLGISGGEEGARNGPAMMAGGDRDAYERARPMLEAIAAKYHDEPCCALVGADGAGHFVKMVHNGIEYGIMQIIAEAYMIMRDVHGMDAAQIGKVFEAWDETDLQSYLIEISGKVLARTDDLADGYLVDAILDKAGQKGTGRWSSEAALAFGIPTLTITEAVFARAMASLKDERVKAAEILTGPNRDPMPMTETALEALRAAVLASTIIAYAQGLALIRAAAKEQGWVVDMPQVAKIWRSGCVIRSVLLRDIASAYSADPDLQNLVCAPEIAEKLSACQTGWRDSLGLAIRHGIPVPGLMSALAYFDGYRTARGSANMLQAQRDFFGAHTYERLDQSGVFHTEW